MTQETTMTESRTADRDELAHAICTAQERAEWGGDGREWCDDLAEGAVGYQVADALLATWRVVRRQDGDDMQRLRTELERVTAEHTRLLAIIRDAMGSEHPEDETWLAVRIDGDAAEELRRMVGRFEVVELTP